MIKYEFCKFLAHAALEETTSLNQTIYVSMQGVS